MMQTVTDLDFYATYDFCADASEPIDRWGQFAQSANLAAVRELLHHFELGADHRVVLDPFCGTGSTLLAAAQLDRSSAGGDVDALAAAVSTLKLGAPALTEGLLPSGFRNIVGDSNWRLAHRVAAAMGFERVDAIVEDCRELRPQWNLDRHAVACVGAESIAHLARARFKDSVFDVFCSPPHATGRTPIPTDLANRFLLDDMPAPFLQSRRDVHARRPPNTFERTTALQALSACLLVLFDAERLRRVVVEFERSVERPNADADVVRCVERSGLTASQIVTLYHGSPDGTEGVLSGGVVVAEP